MKSGVNIKMRVCLIGGKLFSSGWLAGSEAIKLLLYSFQTQTSLLVMIQWRIVNERL